MTEKNMKKKAGETAEKIEKWADDTKELVAETAAFLEELKSSGFEMPQQNDRKDDPETIFRNVTDCLEKAKETMERIRHSADL